MKHTSLSGQIIDCKDLDPKVERFIERARAVLEDKRATENDLIALVYGKENPLLDPTFFPERGAVTAEVLTEPAYHVLQDLIARKRVLQDGKDPAKLGAKYTVTIPEAAALKGVSEDAIRKAIRERRLPAWVRDDVTYLEPRTLDAMSIGGRGPVPKKIEPLTIRYGYHRTEGAFLKFKDQSGVREIDDRGNKAFASSMLDQTDELKRWRRVGVLTGGHGKVRFFELVPSTEESPEPIEFHGFFVRGKYMVLRKVNNAKLAREAWEAFSAS
jgi:hypothetical protein